MPQYVVQPGDTLSGIAQKVGLGAGNYGQLGYSGDPTKLQSGTVLNYGAPANASTAAPSGNSSGTGYNTPAITSTPAPDATAAYAPIDDQIKQTNDARTALINSITGTQSGLENDYQGAVKGQETMSDAYKRLYDQNGIGDLATTLSTQKTALYNTKSVLNNLDKTIAGQFDGSNISQAMEDRMKEVRGGQINDQINQLQNEITPTEETYNTATANVNTQLQLEQQDQAKALLPYQQKITDFAATAARQISGFDENAQSTLTTNLQKISDGLQLSEKEWEQTQQAALQKEQYDNAFKIAQTQAAAQIQAAGISAGGSVAGAGVTANAGLLSAALAAGYPSVKAYQDSLAGGGNIQTQELNAIKARAAGSSGISLQGSGSSSASPQIQGAGTPSWASAFGN